MKTFARDLPLIDGYDLVVCGGGPSGIPAALAASRAGLKVLLVEATGQLGGVGTSAGVSHLLGGRTYDNRHQCVGGIFKEITEALYERGEAIDPRTIKEEEFPPFGWAKGLAAGVPFNPIAMIGLLDEKMLDAGVDVLYFTSFVDAYVDGDQITHLVLFNKSGLFAVPVKYVVDATGDADVAARSGCDIVKGRNEDGLMTPATLIFHVDHVDQEETQNHIYATGEFRFRALIQDLRAKGLWNFPYDIFISVQLHEKGTMMINTTRICDVDGTDGRSISKGMMQGRREVHELMNVMRKYIPGFQQARIRQVAPVLGIRETRRIQGEFIFSVEQVLAEEDFADTIGFSGYGWDLPDPKKPSYQPVGEDESKRMRRNYTPIPYRCLVPKPVGNVICPGRAISVERDVLGPLREQAPCYAMGHAAGLATVQAMHKQIAYRDVDTDELRQTLVRQDAIVDWQG